MKKGWVVWFTGLHGAGKSTIAEKLTRILREKNISLILLDGDNLRKTISSDLGYSVEDRNKHMKRVADLCKVISDNGILAIASVASPTEASREYARKNVKKFFLVYVKCPLEVCEKRDVKGHYKKSREKEKDFQDFINISSNYEEPKNPDIILNTDKESIEESISNLLTKLKEKDIIKWLNR